jgi:hypothetical protein
VRKGANLFPIIGAVVALQAIFSIASLATDGGGPEERAKQAGEDRWVPSLAITGGATIQTQQGSADSCLFPGSNDPNRDCNSRGKAPDLPVRGFFDGDDLSVAPFVGANLELMAPALPIPTRPRLFASGEILPTFASDRRLVLEGNPGCISGPEPDVGCARDEKPGVRRKDFGEDSVNGAGSRTTAQVGTLVFGASLGVAFPLQFGRRQLRIKPSVGWLNYEVKAEALVADAACNPVDQCTDVTGTPGDPPTHGYLRERTLTASDSQRFNGIGPGLDVEMDAGRFGSIGVSLFMGARAYLIVDDRTISFRTGKFFPERRSDLDDPPDRVIFEQETDVGAFEVEVDPWIFRAHVGIRFQWLGSQQ